MNSSFYMYINSDDLNNYLVKNFIYPYDENFESSRSLSLLCPNGVFVTKHKIDNSLVSEYCKIGFFQPIVLEMDLDLSKTRNVIKVDEVSYLINDIITFSCVKKIFHIENGFYSLIFNDIYLFESLLSETSFIGDESFEISILSDKKMDNISNKIFLWDKVQAFYLTRFGFLLDASYDKRNVITFKRNIDLDSFKYISDEHYLSFINDYYCKNDVKKVSSTTYYTDTTYLNDNFEKILKMCISDNNEQFVVSNDEECLFYNEIFKIALYSKNPDEFKSKIFESIKTFENIYRQIEYIYGNIYDSLAKIKKYFKDNVDRKLMLIFILLEIVEKDLDSALAYISNFTKSSEFEKELISLYGLVNGMNSINAVVKQKADTLLFAFNKTKKYFNEYVDISTSYSEYYNIRSYKFENIMKDGFDLKIFDKKEEEMFISNFFTDYLSRKFNISKKQFAKKLFKAPSSANELHTLFIHLKKEASKWEH